MVVEINDIDDKIKFALDVILKEAKEEDLMVKQCFYGMLSAYTNNPLNVGVEAGTGEGKNWVISKVSDIMAKEDVMNLAGMSDKALYHRAGKVVIKNENNGEYEDGEKILKDYESELKEINDKLNSDKLSKADKASLNSQKETIEEDMKETKKKLMKLIDISHKILIYLDSPRSGLISNIMSMLSHDKYEIEYEYADSTQNGIRTRVNVLRGWPAWFYLQAIDTSHYKRAAEINRRHIKVNPNMCEAKYKAAGRLTAQKMSTPDFMYQAEVVSDREKDKAREIVRQLRDKILSICGAVDPGKYNVIIPFWEVIDGVLSVKSAKDMTFRYRLFTWLSLLPVVKFEKRPYIVIRRAGQIIKEVLPFALFEDLKEAIYLMAYTSGVRPNLLEWLNDVFVKAYGLKTDVDRKTVGGVLVAEEDVIALTAEELIKATKDKTGETLTAKQLWEKYLRPLMTAGYIDSKQSSINRRNHIYWWTGITPNDSNNGSIIVDAVLDHKTMNDDDAAGNETGKSTLKICSEYIQKVVQLSSDDCVFCDIYSHEGNKITVDELVEKYYRPINNNSGKVPSSDDDSTEAKLASFGQTEAENNRSESKTMINDDTMINGWSCRYCNFQTESREDYDRHTVNRHHNKAGYPDKNDRSK